MWKGLGKNKETGMKTRNVILATLVLAGATLATTITGCTDTTNASIAAYGRAHHI